MFKPHVIAIIGILFLLLAFIVRVKKIEDNNITLQQKAIKAVSQLVPF